VSPLSRFAACLFLALPAWSGADASADEVRAIWRTQQIDFRVISPRTQFRCEECALRLTSILDAVGATLEATSELYCPESFSTTLRGRLVVKSPFVADEANLAQAKAAITSSDRLLARLKGRADPQTLIRSFPATWESVSSSTHPSLRRLDASDCELLQAVVRQLLPRMSIRDAQFRRSCSSRAELRFSAVALVRAEDPDRTLKLP
jgi:hypothetical protein